MEHLRVQEHCSHTRTRRCAQLLQNMCQLHAWYFTLNSVLIQIICGMCHENRGNFRFWSLYKFQMTYYLQPSVTNSAIIGDGPNCSLLECVWQDEQYDTIYSKIKVCFNLWRMCLTFKVNDSHLRNNLIDIVSGLSKLCAKSHSANRYFTIDLLNGPANTHCFTV